MPIVECAMDKECGPGAGNRDLRESRLQAIRRHLSTLPLRRLGGDFRGEAAVLMSLMPRGDDFSFLLTRRSDKVATHKGQISFPGGHRQGLESLRQTALRETREELGVDGETIQVLGAFHEYQSATDTRVRSYVGLLRQECEIAPNPDEVEELLWVPLGFFESSEPRVEQRERDGRRLPLYFWDYQGETVWGLTAAMIRDFVEMLRR